MTQTSDTYLKYFMGLSILLVLLVVAIIIYILTDKKDSKRDSKRDSERDSERDSKRDSKRNSKKDKVKHIKVSKPHRAVCVISPDDLNDSADVICIPTKTDVNNREIHPLTGEIATTYNSYDNLRQCNRKIATGRSMCTEMNYIDPYYYRYWGNYYLPYVNGRICNNCNPVCDGNNCGEINIYVNNQGEEVAAEVAAEVVPEVAVSIPETALEIPMEPTLPLAPLEIPPPDLSRSIGPAMGGSIAPGGGVSPDVILPGGGMVPDVMPPGGMPPGGGMVPDVMPPGGSMVPDTMGGDVIVEPYRIYGSARELFSTL